MMKNLRKKIIYTSLYLLSFSSLYSAKQQFTQQEYYDAISYIIALHKEGLLGLSVVCNTHSDSNKEGTWEKILRDAFPEDKIASYHGLSCNLLPASDSNITFIMLFSVMCGYLLDLSRALDPTQENPIALPFSNNAGNRNITIEDAKKIRQATKGRDKSYFAQYVKEHYSNPIVPIEDFKDQYAFKIGFNKYQNKCFFNELRLFCTSLKDLVGLFIQKDRIYDGMGDHNRSAEIDQLAIAISIQEKVFNETREGKFLPIMLYSVKDNTMDPLTLDFYKKLYPDPNASLPEAQQLCLAAYNQRNGLKNQDDMKYPDSSQHGFGQPANVFNNNLNSTSSLRNNPNAGTSSQNLYNSNASHNRTSASNLKNKPNIKIDSKQNTSQKNTATIILGFIAIAGVITLLCFAMFKQNKQTRKINRGAPQAVR